jgi:hypothetical protein
MVSPGCSRALRTPRTSPPRSAVLTHRAFARELAVHGRRWALDFDAPEVTRRYVDLVRNAARRVRDECCP